MRSKKEKTEHGTVKAIIPRKKHVAYGKIPPKLAPSGEDPEEEIKAGMPDPEGTEQGEEMEVEMPMDLEPAEESEDGEPMSPINAEAMEKLQQMLDQMAQEDEAEEKEAQEKEAEENLAGDKEGGDEKKEDQDGEPEQKDGGEDQQDKDQDQKEEEKDDKDQDKKKDDKQDQKQKNDHLTEWLKSMLRIRALGEVFGAIKVATPKQSYYSYSLAQGERMEVLEIVSDKSVIFDFNTFPTFDNKAKADAFLELCSELLFKYCDLTSKLNATDVATKGDIEVIHKK